jgi:hypothetical protein
LVCGEAQIRRAGRNVMKRYFTTLAIAVLTALGVWAAPAHAAPPTATPSPGYDARLQEQRSAPVIYQPETPPAKPTPRRRLKRTH